jgi:hypothetical protein
MSSLPPFTGIGATPALSEKEKKARRLSKEAEIGRLKSLGIEQQFNSKIIQADNKRASITLQQPVTAATSQEQSTNTTASVQSLGEPTSLPTIYKVSVEGR